MSREMTEHKRRTKFYRNKQDGKIAGVCAGIADYTGIDVVFVRVFTVVMFFASSGIILPAYILLALFSDRKPIDLYRDNNEEKFWQGVRRSPKNSARDVKSKLRDIDRRLADVEHFYTSENRQLADEIERLR